MGSLLVKVWGGYLIESFCKHITVVSFLGCLSYLITPLPLPLLPAKVPPFYAHKRKKKKKSEIVGFPCSRLDEGQMCSPLGLTWSKACSKPLFFFTSILPFKNHLATVKRLFSLDQKKRIIFLQGFHKPNLP